MRWQEKVFGPMRERTLENAQLHLLSTRYDFSRRSRLGQAIIRKVNNALDEEERRRGITRVRTGELLLRTRRGYLILPLRTEDDLDRLMAGERWDVVRRDIMVRCERRYRELFPDTTSCNVEGFLCGLFQGRAPRLTSGGSPWHGPREQRPWNDRAADYRPARTRKLSQTGSRVQFPQIHEQDVMPNLKNYLDVEAGIPKAIQEPMLLELMACRARFHPRFSTVSTGQMPLAAMHVNSGRNLWMPTNHQPLAPVLINVVTDDERQILWNRPPQKYEAYLGFHGKRIARVLTEAYMQDGLLSFSELQWVFLLSQATVSRAVDFYQRQHQVILPCPGTVLDMGRMLTHKDLVVRLHLQGHNVTEISRKTYHSPRSVDAYLKAFDAVLILHLYGLPPQLMSTTLGRGQYLIDEYLELIDEHLKDVEHMRRYLQQRGVEINISHGG